MLPIACSQRRAGHHRRRSRRAHAYPTTFHLHRKPGPDGVVRADGCTGAHPWLQRARSALRQAVLTGDLHPPALWSSGIRNTGGDGAICHSADVRVYRAAGGPAWRAAEAGGAPWAQTPPTGAAPVVRCLHRGRSLRVGRCRSLQRCRASTIKPVAISTNRYSLSDWRTQRRSRPGSRR